MYLLKTKTNTEVSNRLLLAFAVLLASSLVLTPLLSVPQYIESSRTIDPVIPVTPAISPTLLDYVATHQGEMINVLIQTETQEYDPIIEAITKLGAINIRTFQYANGLAASIPDSVIMQIARLPGIVLVSLDSQRIPASLSQQPSLDRGTDLDTFMKTEETLNLNMDNYRLKTLPLNVLESNPETYYNYFSMNPVPIWSTGNFGQDSLVVVIDTGIQSNHTMLTGNVIGGVDMSPDVGTAFEGFDLPSNHWHGTHVSGIVAGHAAIILPYDDLLAMSWEYHTGGSLLVNPNNASERIMPLLGMAPSADLYGIKVFPHTGAGVPESYIIAGIEHAISLHVSGAYDVDVISMSLGGSTLFDGRDLEDQTVDYATSLGITVVTSAGNDGPASMTVGSPGSANTAIAVGAAAHPVNTRIFWDVAQYGILGIGDFLFTSDEPQIYAFSSRGPTSDGRGKPTLSATGIYVLSAITGSGYGLAWASGTSMACPAVSGTVALLNHHGETVGASPYDYQQALVKGAEKLSGYDKYDQGAGFLDAGKSMAKLLADKHLGSEHPRLRHHYWSWPARPKGTKIPFKGFSWWHGWYHKKTREQTYTLNIKELLPGHARHLYFRATDYLKEISLEFSNIDLGTNLGLNSFEVYVQSAVRTTLVSYLDTVNVFGDASFTIEDLSTTGTGAYDADDDDLLYDLPLMPGYVRIVIENDWTSFDAISGQVEISIVEGPGMKADDVYSGKLNNHESWGFESVGFGPAGVQLDLSWRHDWTRYPATDLDMIVSWFDTDDGLHWDYSGATLNSPEKVRIEATDIAEVLVLVIAYETLGIRECWTLEVHYLG
ncbi:MAG: S8 family serine peptidase [Candidatus Thorarchaeota archaeon]